MRKIITYLIIYCLTFNYSYAIELQSITGVFASPLNAPPVYEDSNGSPEKQFDHAMNLKRIKNPKAARAFKEFVEKYPNHKLVEDAIYNYGLHIRFDLDLYPKFYNNQTTPFEILINNFPKTKYIGGELYDDAYYLHLSTLETAIAKILFNGATWNERPEKSKLKIFNELRTKYCKGVLSKNPRHSYGIQRIKIGDRYKRLKCFKFEDSLNNSVKAPDKSKKTQTGFVIDVLDQNKELKEYFNKYQLIFDFQNFTVKQLILYNDKKYSSYPRREISRNFDILNINNQKIRIQQTFYDLMDFCRSFNKDFARVDYTLNESGNFDKTYMEVKNIPVDDCNISGKTFWDNQKDRSIRGSSGNNPYLYIDLNLKNYDIKKTYFPLNQKYIKTSKRTKFKDKDKIGKIIEILFWVAVAYLVVNQIKDIKKMSSSSKHSNKVSKNTSSFTSKGVQPSHNDIFFGRYNGNQIYKANQIRFKVLKYYGWGF